MAKHSFTEKYSVNVCGIYNKDSSTIEVNGTLVGLLELFDRLDGEEIKLSVVKQDVVNE